MARWIERRFSSHIVNETHLVCNWLNELEKQEKVLGVCTIPLNPDGGNRMSTRPFRLPVLILVRLDDEDEEGDLLRLTIQESIANSVN